MNYELKLSGYLKIDYENKNIIFPTVSREIYAPVADITCSCFGNMFINKSTDKENYITYLRCCPLRNTNKDFRHEKVHLPIKNNVNIAILNDENININKYKLTNDEIINLVLNEFLNNLIKSLHIPIYICYYNKYINGFPQKMFASFIKYYQEINDSFNKYEIDDGTFIYNLLNTSFSCSVLYISNNKEEKIIYKYSLKDQINKNDTRQQTEQQIKGGDYYENVLKIIILKSKLIIMILFILLIIVIIIYIIRDFKNVY